MPRWHSTCAATLELWAPRCGRSIAFQMNQVVSFVFVTQTNRGTWKYGSDLTHDQWLRWDCPWLHSACPNMHEAFHRGFSRSNLPRLRVPSGPPSSQPVVEPVPASNRPSYCKFATLVALARLAEQQSKPGAYVQRILRHKLCLQHHGTDFASSQP